jgi:hypothetical protein
MSSIQGFDEKTNDAFKLLENKYNIVLTNSKKIEL